MSATTITLTAFIQSAGVTMTATRIPTRTDIDLSDWHANASHWRCLIHAGKSRMTVYFSQGSAHTSPPTASDVLDCLASDACSYDNAPNFGEWCVDFGYDPDSRKAERLFKTVGRQAVALKRLLGDSAYTALLWDVERE